MLFKNEPKTEFCAHFTDDLLKINPPSLNQATFSLPPNRSSRCCGSCLSKGHNMMCSDFSVTIVCEGIRKDNGHLVSGWPVLEHSCRKFMAWSKFTWVRLTAWWAVALGIGCEFVFIHFAEERKQLSFSGIYLNKQIKWTSTQTVKLAALVMKNLLQYRTNLS